MPTVASASRTSSASRARIGFSAEHPVQTEHDVVAHRHFRQHQRLLENGRDAGRLRRARGRSLERLAVPFAAFLIPR